MDDDAVALAATVVERREILTGAIMINTNRANDPGFGAGSPLGLVLMHELGHVVGLDHVPDAASMMHPTADLPAAVWAAGDLAGLKAVGRGAGCL